MGVWCASTDKNWATLVSKTEQEVDAKEKDIQGQVIDWAPETSKPIT